MTAKQHTTAQNTHVHSNTTMYALNKKERKIKRLMMTKSA